ncbi:MAG: M20 family metallopeptidase [Odoribacter sp.]
MEEEEVFKLAIKFRRHIHRRPEISTQEFETQAYIVGILEEHQIVYQLVGTGVIARIGEGERCVALRADIDALRVNEETGLEYSSEHPGIMHACGHDMHTAMLLGAALILKSREKELGGTVKLIFQPSEEKRPGGARLLLPHLMEFPKPQAIFGQHIFPDLPVGTVGIRAGAFFASSDNIIFAVEGKGTHAAMPQLGADPILATVALIQFYQTIITKFRNPLIPAVLSITSIHGGTANNIIPDRVEVLGTVRTHNNELRHRIFELINEKSPSICDLYGCRFLPDMTWNGLPPLVNDRILTERVKTVAHKSPLVENIIDSEPLTLGEDFAIYLEHLPGAFWTLGVCPSEIESMPPLHNSRMAPDERAIPIGIQMLVGVCCDFLRYP